MLSIFRKIKRKIEIKKFRKNGKIGLNTTFGFNSKCFVEKGGVLIIGSNCDIDSSIIVKENGFLSIGDYSTVRFNSKIGCLRKISIGNYCMISNNVTIYDNNNHPTEPEKRKQMCLSGFYSDLWKWKHSTQKDVIIEDNVFIGEGSTILKGVTIGKNSFVACKSVVTKDVPPNSMVAGNPARVVKKIA